MAVKEKAIARAEIIIEGELLPGVRVREDQHTNTGHAMPEFPGYCGEANPSLPVIKVKAVTMRNHAILQTLVGPGKNIPRWPDCRPRPASAMPLRRLFRASCKTSMPIPQAAASSSGYCR